MDSSSADQKQLAALGLRHAVPTIFQNREFSAARWRRDAIAVALLRGNLPSLIHRPLGILADARREAYLAIWSPLNPARTLPSSGRLLRLSQPAKRTR